MLSRSIEFTEVALAFRTEDEVPASFSARLAAALDSIVVEDAAALGAPDALFAGFARLHHLRHAAAAKHTFSTQWHRVDDLRLRTGVVRERNGPSEYLLDLDRETYRISPRDDGVPPQSVVFDAATNNRARAQRGRDMVSYQQRLIDRSDGSKHGLAMTRWSTEHIVALTGSHPPCHDFRIDISSDIEVASGVGAAFGHSFVPHDVYGWDWYGSLMTRFVRVALGEAGCVTAMEEPREPADGVRGRAPEVGHLLLSERTVIDVVEYTTPGVVRDHIIYVRDRGDIEFLTVRDDSPPLHGLRPQAG